MKTKTIYVVVKLTVASENRFDLTNEALDEFQSEMEYSFKPGPNDPICIVDTEIVDFNAAWPV